MGRGRKHSAKLDDVQRQELAEWAVNHPEQSDRDIGLRFGCSPHQVRYARQKADAGEIIVRRDRVSDQLRVAGAMSSADKEEMLERQVLRTLAQLDVDEDMPADRRSWCLDKITRIERMLQEMRLVSHLKAANAGIISELVRLFEPDATEQQIIEHYVAAEQRWNERPR